MAVQQPNKRLAGKATPDALYVVRPGALPQRFRRTIQLMAALARSGHTGPHLVKRAATDPRRGHYLGVAPLYQNVQRPDAIIH